MKMKRSVILSLFAAALTALCATTAEATVNVQLNLFYEDPASAGDPNMGGPVGGTWQLLVQSTATNGIAGIVFVVDNIDGVVGPNNGNVNPNSQVFDETDSIFKFQPTGVGTEVEIVAGDDLDGPLVLGVGTGSGSPGNRAVDDLRSSFWDHSALIASGAFGANGRPELISVGANEFGADPNSISPATNGTQSVRGDAAEVQGLEATGTGLLLGDADRDGDVTIADFGILQVNFPLAPGSLTWNQADFDSDGDVTIADFGLLQVTFPATPASPPPITSNVPEPSTIAMLCVAGLAVVSRRRRTL